MRAAHARLARLYRLGAVPAQRVAAWRSAGDALTALDPALDPGADDVRLQALLGAPQFGAPLAAAMARLDATTPEPDLHEPDRVPQRQQAIERRAPSDKLTGRTPAARDGTTTLGAMAPSGRPAGRPVPPQAPARRPAMPWPQAASTRPWDAPEVGAAPATGHRVGPSDAAAVAGSAGRADAPARAVDAAEAARQLDARSERADLRAAWHQVVRASSPVRGTADHDPAGATVEASNARGAPDPGVGPGVRSDAEHAPPMPSRSAELGGLLQAPPAMATPVGRRRPDAARTDAPAGATEQWRTPVPLQAARIGGFRGLAELGRAEPQAARAPAPARLQPPAVLSEHPVRDPQGVIDQIEAALREQAARSGVALDGGEP